MGILTPETSEREKGEVSFTGSGIPNTAKDIQSNTTINRRSLFTL
jgi:hypothetical protein